MNGICLPSTRCGPIKSTPWYLWAGWSWTATLSTTLPRWSSLPLTPATCPRALSPAPTRCCRWAGLWAVMGVFAPLRMSLGSDLRLPPPRRAACSPTPTPIGTAWAPTTCSSPSTAPSGPALPTTSGTGPCACSTTRVRALGTCACVTVYTTGSPQDHYRITTGRCLGDPKMTRVLK